MKTLLLYNPQAGLAHQLRPDVESLTAHTSCVVHTNPQDFERNALEKTIQHHAITRIVVAGGDGTLHQVVNALAPIPPDVELAVAPCGTGNDFARSIAARPEHLIDLCTNPDFGTRQPVDLIKVNEPSTTYLLNAASGGLGAEVTSDLQTEDKKLWGALSYWIHALGKLSNLHPYDLHIETDDEVIERQGYGVVVCNGRYVGGGFPVAPEARLNDGLCDLILIPKLPILELLGAGVNYAVGLPELSGSIIHLHSRSFRLTTTPAMKFSLDGEPATFQQTTFSTLEGALNMVVANEAPALNQTAQTV